MNERIILKIKEITAEQLDRPIDEISDNASFTDDLAADSLDVTEITMKLEEEFDFEIPDEDVEKLSTVSGAIQYVTNKLAPESVT